MKRTGKKKEKEKEKEGKERKRRRERTQKVKKGRNPPLSFERIRLVRNRKRQVGLVTK